jgi:hypothetical protein
MREYGKLDSVQFRSNFARLVIPIHLDPYVAKLGDGCNTVWLNYDGARDETKKHEADKHIIEAF